MNVISSIKTQQMGGPLALFGCRYPQGAVLILSVTRVYYTVRGQGNGLIKCRIDWQGKEWAISKKPPRLLHTKDAHLESKLRPETKYNKKQCNRIFDDPDLENRTPRSSDIIRYAISG